MMAVRRTPRDKAMATIGEHEKSLAKWEAEKASALAELDGLQRRAGEEVLADETAAARLTSSMQQLRDRIDIAGRAVEAVRPKLAAAKRVAVLAEADEIETEAAQARAQLDVHEARTAELLAALEGHEGRFVSVQDAAFRVDSENWARLMDGAPALKSDPLREAVRRAELRAFVLREVANGRDPQPTLREQASITDGSVAGVAVAELYSSSVWGPTALIPAPAFEAQLEEMQASLSRLDDEIATLPDQIVDVEQRQASTPHRLFPSADSKRDRLENDTAQREQLAADLETLTGTKQA